MSSHTKSSEGKTVRLRYFLLVLCLVIAIAVVLPYPFLPPSPEFDFEVLGSSPIIYIATSGEASYNVTVALIREPIQPVSLTLSGLPKESHISYSLNPSSGNPTFHSMVILKAYDSPVGDYRLTLTGTGGGKIHSITVTMMVIPGC
jgi:hypothetical protein